MSLPERIIKDEDHRKQKQEELILFMGSPIYKHICNKMQMRPRTLLNLVDITDKLIKDDSVLIQLRQDCESCKAQLLEPKLKKALQSVKLG